MGDLDDLVIPESIHICPDLHCSNVQHKEDIDNYLYDLVDTLESATKSNIPYTKKKTIKPGDKKTKIAGWTEQIKPHKDFARFHFQLWLCGGKPREGPLYENMCKSRNQFKLAKRKCINAAESIKTVSYTHLTLPTKRIV